MDESPQEPWRVIVVGGGTAHEEHRLGEIAQAHQYAYRIQLCGEITDSFELEEIAADCGVHLVPGYAGLNVVDAASLGLLSILAPSNGHAPEWEDLAETSSLKFADSGSAEDLAYEVRQSVLEMDEVEMAKQSMWARQRYSPAATAAAILSAKN